MKMCDLYGACTNELTTLITLAMSGQQPSSLPHFLLTCGLVLSKYQWTFCQATCLLEKILGIFSLRNKDPMFRPNNLYSKKENKRKRWQWKPNKELAQYLQRLAFRKSNARR